MRDHGACVQRAQRDAAASAAEAARVATDRAAAAARILPEPPAAASGPVLAALFQLPDGGRPRRRFALDAPVDALFDFVDGAGGGGAPPRGYRLVTRFPRRVLAAGGGGTLREAQLSAGQEVFVVEAL